jgi:TetR/AcrR family transcriptional repressor of nem operon
MKTAGLTHGGFYRYFPSKEDLKSQACCLMVKRTAEGWNPLASDESSTSAVQAEEAQKFVALACDSARESPRLQATFADGLEALIGKLCKNELKANPSLRREETLSALVSLVGATVLARAVGRNRIGDEIRAVADETVRLSGVQKIDPSQAK